jgi:hypothetical protein
MKESLLMMNPSLPDGFPHTAPEHYYYECKNFKSNVVSIWLCNTQSYAYTTDSPIRTIWGFVKYKRTKRSTTHTYYAPINCNKIGKEVCISDTRPYTAMQLNLNPLEAAFFS